MTVQEATRLLTDRAEELNATPNDESGVVRELVLAHNLGFNAWFVVCCELADRRAKREGFKDQCDRAFQLATKHPSFKFKCA